MMTVLVRLATGRILEPHEWGPAADALAGRRLSELTLGGVVEPAYFEIRP